MKRNKENGAKSTNHITQAIQEIFYDVSDTVNAAIKQAETAYVLMTGTVS